MTRRVKEYVDFREHLPLDDLINELIALRDTLPEDAGAELKLRGDEVFGRRITITFQRPLTEQEAEIEKRYAAETLEAKQRELERLQEELGVVCHAVPRKRGKLRIVA